MKTYPEMNVTIIGLLRTNTENMACLYAATRIEELEAQRAILLEVLTLIFGIASRGAISNYLGAHTTCEQIRDLARATIEEAQL